jgi:hypothetical protein
MSLAGDSLFGSVTSGLCSLHRVGVGSKQRQSASTDSNRA